MAGGIWLVLFGLMSSANAGDQPTGMAAFLAMNCTGCHDGNTDEGALNLESLTMDLADPANFHLWERVFDRVRDGEMPPDETLDANEIKPFLFDLHGRLKTTDSERVASEGRVPARRLTRAQYERNVCELLAIDVPLSEYLPEESLPNGFETVSKSQQISDHSMAAYLKAADAALDESFNRLLTDARSPIVRLDWSDLRRDENRTNREPEGRPEHQDIVSWSTRQNFYGRMPATSVPATGRYRIRLSARAIHPPASGRIWCSIESGVCNAKASTLYWIDGFEATVKPTVHQFDAWIIAGHQLRILPNDRGLRKVPVPKVGGPAGTVEPLGVPGLAIKWLELQRIVPDRSDVHQALVGDLQLREVESATDDEQIDKFHRFEINTENPQQQLASLIKVFAERAFRRPVNQDDLNPYIGFAMERLAADGNVLNSLRAAYRAILCSPRFLYFEESPGRLDEHALANRLSHFLWGVAPDSELRELAESKQLSNPVVLRQQTDRLLNDARSATFVREFTDQWLTLYELNSTTPDSKLYPEYDDMLHHSLTQETHKFVDELIRENLPVRNVVDSDFTFLNSRLARHYDIVWPGGTGLQRVALDAESHRGGIISHASVLKVTANGTTTSPILRGVWMLERIMGQHVPPPPANVPAVEPDIRGATSIREQIKKHKEMESCAACHLKIDPPGFALESYDVIGGWRENYRAVGGEEGKDNKWTDGQPVDPSHTLASGESFDGIDALKAILVAHPDRLAKNLASHLITYSTGAAPTFADRDAVQAIVAAIKSSQYGVRSLVHEVIQSPLFTIK